MNIINYIKGLFKTEQTITEIKIESNQKPMQKGIELYKTNKYKQKYVPIFVGYRHCFLPKFAVK